MFTASARCGTIKERIDFIFHGVADDAVGGVSLATIWSLCQKTFRALNDEGDLLPKALYKVFRRTHLVSSVVNIRERVANVPLIFAFSTFTAGFVAGWAADSAVLSASGYVNISNDRLNRLQKIDRMKKDDINDEIDSLESDSAKLLQRLMINRPPDGNLIKNIRFLPPNRVLNAGDMISVDFDYTLNPNEEAWISVVPETFNGRFDRAISASGSGHGAARFTLSKPGEVSTVNIEIDAKDGEKLDAIRVPTQFEFQ